MIVNKRILYISYDGMTDPLGQSQVLPYLTGLSGLGYVITLLSFEKKERFEQGKEAIDHICNQNGIKWQPQFYTKKPPVLSTVKDVRMMKKQAAILHKAERFDIVHCRSYISALAGIWMKKKFRTKFVFDMRGFWADERVDGGLWDIKKPLYNMIYRFFKKKEKDFLQTADHIVSLTHNAKNEILSWPYIDAQSTPIEVIPCCVDTELFDPARLTNNDLIAKKNELGIPLQSQVVSYIGSIGTWYMLDEMLDFFKVALHKKADSYFLVVTADEASVINKKAAAKGIPAERIIIRSAKRQEVPLYIAVSDRSLFFIKPAYSKKASSPTKQGEIMAMGKPVICNTGVGDTDLIVRDYQSGILVDAFTTDAYASALSADDQTDPVNIRKGALDFFSLNNGIKRYHHVYQAVLSHTTVSTSS